MTGFGSDSKPLRLQASSLRVAVVLAGGLAAVLAGDAKAEPVFADVTALSGFLDYVHLDGQGGGAAASDFDGDGDIDLFVPTVAGTPNRLYRNLGDGTFENIEAAAGVGDTARTRAALWLDYDGDGLLDLLTYGDCYLAQPSCATTRRTKLYRQVSNASFSEVTAAAGLEGVIPAEPEREVGGMAAGDVDGDGDLDLFLADWTPAEEVTLLDASRLLINDGAGAFVDGTVAAGISLGLPKRLQPLMLDIDADGDLDLYSNRVFGPNELYLNQGSGTFVEGAAAAGLASSWNHLGLVAGDPDNDGDLDLYSTSVETAEGTAWSVLYENVSVGSTIQFNEIATAAGVRSVSWGWGATFIDGENDGWLDLAYTNGNIPPFASDTSRFFRNTGASPLAFADVSTASGFDDALWGSTLLKLDYDRDGDLDLFQTTNSFTSDLLRLLRNTPVPATNHWVVIQPRLASGGNRFAIGARVRVTAGGVTRAALISAGTSYLGQEAAEAHFGLGSEAGPLTVTIDWPDGSSTVATDLAVDQVHVVSPPPIVVDTDGDGLLDSEELTLGTNPSLADTDGDGIPDGIEVGTPLAPRDTDLDTVIDALDTDDDDDGWLTALEDANQNGDWLDDDTDNDGTPNYRDTDSDGDGFGDGAEIAAGTDPLDPLSFPPTPPLVPSAGPLGLTTLGLLLAALGSRAIARKDAPPSPVDG